MLKTLYLCAVVSNRNIRTHKRNEGGIHTYFLVCFDFVGGWLQGVSDLNQGTETEKSSRKGGGGKGSVTINLCIYVNLAIYKDIKIFKFQILSGVNYHFLTQPV